MLRQLRAWPVLLVAGVLLAAGVTLDSTDDHPGLAAVLLSLAASCIGAFLYAEGVAAGVRMGEASRIEERDRPA